MRWLASFAPKRRLTEDSNKSPACARTDRTHAITPTIPSLPTPLAYATATLTATTPARPPTAPAEIGEYVRSPDICEQEQKRCEPPLRIAAQHRRRDQEGAGIDHPSGGP